MARRVLVVDDEESILRSTALLLEALGFQVITLDRSDLILETTLRERPDVLLQDVRMPGLDVDRLVREVRAHPELAHVHIVLFTASMEAGEIAERTGAVMIEKPFGPGALLHALSA